MAEWLNKENNYMLPTRDLVQMSGHTQSEGIKKLFHENENKKKVQVAILISDKMDFQIKTCIRDNEGHT